MVVGRIQSLPLKMEMDVFVRACLSNTENDVMHSTLRNIRHVLD